MMRAAEDRVVVVVVATAVGVVIIFFFVNRRRRGLCWTPTTSPLKLMMKYSPGRVFVTHPLYPGQP
jgi:hypothetical protein